VRESTKAKSDSLRVAPTKILPEGFYTPGWNGDWMETDGRTYYSTTNLQDKGEWKPRRGSKRIPSVGEIHCLACGNFEISLK
jgi:hypothetical protein